MFVGKKKIGKVYAYRSTSDGRGQRRWLPEAPFSGKRNVKRFSLGVRNVYQMFIVFAVAVFRTSRV